jgi:hypothetical protein
MFIIQATGHHAECLYAESHYAECHYDECHGVDRKVRFGNVPCIFVAAVYYASVNAPLSVTVKMVHLHWRSWSQKRR